MIELLLVCDVCGARGAAEGKSFNWSSVWITSTYEHEHLHIKVGKRVDPITKHTCSYSCLSKWVSHSLDEIATQQRNQKQQKQINQ